LTIPLAHAWSNSSRLYGGVQEYLGEENEHLILFSKKKLKENPHIDYFIFGHRHILLDLPIGEKSKVVILGDWITYFSYSEFDGERLTLKRWEE
jgi:UDP-2,3-diacylglucosamine hydrolase